MAFVAVQWCEDPPKWDVLNLKDVVEEDVSVGDTVTAKYGQGRFPAKVIGLGTYLKNEHMIVGVL